MPQGRNNRTLPTSEHLVRTAIPSHVALAPLRASQGFKTRTPKFATPQTRPTGSMIKYKNVKKYLQPLPISYLFFSVCTALHVPTINNNIVPVTE